MNVAIASMLLVVLTAAGESKPVATITFDGDADLYALQQGSELTGEKARALDGEQSLLADSRGKMREWYEFFTSRPGLLKPGYVYHVTLSYRVDEADDDAYLYGLFRSKGKGWGKFDRGWTNIKGLAEQIGKTQTATMEVGLDNLDDYQLMLGLRGNARVVIDNIRISQGQAYHEPTEEEKTRARLEETAELIHHFDFDKLPANARLFDVGKLTTDPELALDDNGSLYADTTTAKDDWVNILWLPNTDGMTPERVILKPGYIYHILLKYRTLDKVDGKAFAYMLARSKKHGHGDHDRGWKQWGIADGKAGTAYNRIEILNGDDYYLALGVHKGAKMVFDDLEIYRESVEKKPIAKRTPMTPTDENLVWREEFDGEKIDTSKWKILGPSRRRGGFWLPEKAYLDGEGHLALEFDKHKDTFAMAAIETSDAVDWTYGYFEARMKLPTEQGHWPGFWLFAGSVNNVGNEGRDGTEIDIVEAPWRNKDAVSHALHWDGYGDDHKSQGRHVDIEGVNEGWHTYAVEWSPDGYIFFVDGKETWRTTAGGVCENPLYIILSDEMGGWSGNPRNAKNLPDKTYVDYVRVWQTDEWRKADEKRRQAATEK